MSSTEEVAYPILRKHDVEYVLVIFGGLIGYSGDDINKFLWMVRIAQGVWPDEIQEPNYFTAKGEYRIDDAAPATMKESLMYKMSYYRCVPRPLAHACAWMRRALLIIRLIASRSCSGGQQAVDRVRGQQVPKTGPTLDHLGELLIVPRCECGPDRSADRQTRRSPPRTGSYVSHRCRGSNASLTACTGPDLPGQEGGPPWTRPQERERVRAGQEEEKDEAALKAQGSRVVFARPVSRFRII